MSRKLYNFKKSQAYKGQVSGEVSGCERVELSKKISKEENLGDFL